MMRATLFTLLLSLALVGELRAQKGMQMPAFGGSANEARGTLYSRVVDGAIRVAIEIQISDHYHLYHDDLGNPDAIGLPTIVTLGPGEVRWSDVRFPEPLVLEQADFDTWIYGHEGRIVLYALGETDADPGTLTVSADMDGLTCEDDGSCIPYEEVLTSRGPGPDALFADFPADLSVGGGDGGAGTGADGEGAGTTAAADTDDEPEHGGTQQTAAEYDAVTFRDFEPRGDQATHGLGVWLLLAFLAGMILNVMPCVLPVISIKILSFVQQAGEDRKRILALGTAFAGGIVVVFLGLASLAAFFGLSWGEQFQSQTFLVVMIGLVFAFALSMFGVYELGVPSGVGQLAGGPPREGLGDAFFKGMLATVLATPCSGPFLGSTLTWTLSQDTLVIYAVFLALGLGMALPYVVLTANPAFLKLVPKPGAWMDSFKEAMGFVLLATVIYLMISLQQDLMLFTVAFLMFVGLGCWWWGRFSRTAASAGRKWATLAVALGIVVLGARVTFVEFRGLFTVDAASSAHAWEDFDPERFASLLDAGQPVFLDFTADWCPNCKYNEKFVFDDPDVLAAMAAKGVVRMKADITHDTPRTRMIERLQHQLGARTIPFMAMFPGDEPQRPHVRYDIVKKDDLLGVVDSL